MMKMSKRFAIVLLLLAGGFGRASGQTLTTLWSFSVSDGNGQAPLAGLVQSSDGNFYGTTKYGGNTNLNGGLGVGTVFRITPSGSLTSLHSFSGGDGAEPYAELVQGSDGNFYGTAYYGGASTNCFNGCGTVFQISPGGSFSNLYSFSGNDGAAPRAGLVQGRDGNFYGTTQGGGANYDGTIFRISPTGIFTNLYSFSGSDGAEPYAGLVRGSDGNFYGTTFLGGVSNIGTVFRISPSGSFTNLYSFISGFPGDGPYAGLVQGSDGNFYGTTSGGGTTDAGAVFRISPSGSFTNLYSFFGFAAPRAELVQGSDGNFYGTTVGGGTNSCLCGTVFRISPSGSLTNPYSFNNDSNGALPDARLVQGSDGNFYGTTHFGPGTVFKLFIPLNPPANQISAVQLAGNEIAISIPSVAGETYQLQFSTDLSSGDWSNIPDASVTNSIGAMLTLTNFGGASSPQGFYRFSITP
jgi:uncharacterized repeat protein (TIGR03803 family)